MKKLRYLSLGLSLLATTVQAENFVSYGTPSIDGVLSANEWQEMSRIRMARFYGSDQFADVWLQWDANYLYMAGQFQDYTLTEDGGGSGQPWETWHDDSIEIFLHPATDTSTTLNTNSRILAFTINGKYQRLDRGESGGGTTGLEILGNTTAKMGNSFLNQPVGYDWACSHVLPATGSNPNVTVQYAKTLNGTLNNNADRDQNWTFEVALPWHVVGTTSGQKIVGGNCAVGTGLMPTVLPVADGTQLRMNFFRVGDDDGGNVDPRDAKPDTYFKLNETTDADFSGMLVDEWYVYQGDTNNPQEWATFTLVGNERPADNNAPIFANNNFTLTALTGRRIQAIFNAPYRGKNSDSPAARYEIRYLNGAHNSVDQSLWDTMTRFENGYTPATPNTAQAVDIIGLEPNQTYTIALRAVDEKGNMSQTILSSTIATLNDARNFITVDPTGRSLIYNDGTPFTVIAETALMPWLPLRGLYNGKLCDEHYPKTLGDGTPITLPAEQQCGAGIKTFGANEQGRLRDYYHEKYFEYTDANGAKHSLSTEQYSVEDLLKKVEEKRAEGLTVTQVEGIEIAEDYMAKLKASGVNVLTIFVESLDLDVTPIFFHKSTQGNDPYSAPALHFLDYLIELARKNDVYLILRLYDTYYYKDDNYKTADAGGFGVGRKWSDTVWAKELGKTSPDQFFDADLYQYHKDRMTMLFNRVNERTKVAYRDEEHILGWDIVNEIDNKERFNVANYEQRKAWVNEMLGYAKSQVPHHLIFYSFLTWDPKDSVYYRTNIGQTLNNKVVDEDSYIGMDAELAYRIPNASIAAPHGYYAHIASPRQTPPTTDYARPLELARGISYGFHQIRDGRPIIDTEGAPNPLYIENYDANFTESDDKEMFMNAAWLHFTSGGAGANMRWPIDLKEKASVINQIPADWRALLKIFKDQVGDIRWRGDQLKVEHQKVGEVFTVTRHDNKSAVAYAFNPQKTPLTTIQLKGVPKASGRTIVLLPDTGEILYDAIIDDVSNIPLPRAISNHVAVIVRDFVEGGKAIKGLALDAAGSPVTVSTQFSGGVNLDGGQLKGVAIAKATQEAHLFANIQVDPSHVGKQADLLFVVGTDKTDPFVGDDASYIRFNSQKQQGAVDLTQAPNVWMGQLTEPFISDVTLEKGMRIDLGQHRFNESGAMKFIFAGYRLKENNLIVYTSTPIILQVQ